MNRKQIVLADDEVFISKAYKEGLSRAGFDVTTCLDGLEAYEQITKIKPDLVLLDLIMPGMTGFEVLKKVKESPEVKSVPVIILSNLSQVTDKEEAMQLGAEDFIVKADASLQNVVDRVIRYFDEKA